MIYTIRKKCICRNGKLFNMMTGKFEKCICCQGTGTRVIHTTKKCKYCAEPIESGYFCKSCARDFKESEDE